jgi:3'-phosphoadenosine 5'-phosphosulfate sulfotransferase (PAPS reductase)/FAD synthetase
VNRVHDEARLDRHRRAIAAVDPLDRAGDQSVADIAKSGAAIFVGDRRAEQPQRAHLAHDLAVEPFLHISGGHARLQLLLGIALRRVADEPLLVGQLVIEIERVLPVERQDCRLTHGVAAPEL